MERKNDGRFRRVFKAVWELRFIMFALGLLLVVSASAEHLVCDKGLGTFTSYPLKKCINGIKTSFKYEKVDDNKYKKYSYTSRDCDEGESSRESELPSNCRFGDKPDHVAFKTVAEKSNCDDRDDMNIRDPYYPEDCYNVASLGSLGGSIKYEVDDDKYLITRTYDSKNCAGGSATVTQSCDKCTRLAGYYEYLQCGAAETIVLAVLALLVLLF